MVILASSKLSIGGIEGFICSSEFEFFGVSELLELIGSFLGLEEIVVDCLDLSIIILALFFLECNSVSESVDFILVLDFLLPEFTELILKVVGIFSQSIGLVVLHANLSLESNAFLFPPADLVPNGANLSLVFVVRSVLFVKKESEILNFFSEGV